MTRKLNLTRFRIIQEFTEHTIEDFQEKAGFKVEPPVPVDFIAEALYGLQIKFRDVISRSTKVVATLSVSEKTIYVQSGRHHKSIRYSIAHELGHWILHVSQLYERNDSFDNPILRSNQLERSNRKFSKRQRLDHQESDAHCFARALLCPTSILWREAKQFETIDFEALKELAGEFNVSNQVMLYRLKEVCDYSLWEGPNIDWNSLDPLFPDGSSRTSLIDVKNADFTQQKKSSPNQSKDFEPPKFVQPKIVEFCGTPRAGKDTEIEIVSDVLQDAYGYKVRVVDEGIKNCFIDKKLDVERFFKSMAHTVDELYGARYENPGNCDFIIFNRSLFDRLAFLLALRTLDRITHNQEMIHTNYLLSFTQLVDTVLLFQISPEESLRREYEHSRKIVELIGAMENVPVRNQTMFNKESLSVYNTAYMQILQNYQHQFKKVVLHQGDTVSKLQRSVEILHEILTPTPIQLSMPQLIDYLENSSSNRKQHRSSTKNNIS
jgi:Zn-dependent peptidase ImmA (M78 family)